MACTPPTTTAGDSGVQISDNAFQNAQELLQVSDGGADPTLDGFDENIASGNNSTAATGVLIAGNPNVANSTITPTMVGSIPKQTADPPPITMTPDATNDTPSKAGQGTVPSSTVWTGSYTEALSPNFTVGSFTTGALMPHPLITYLTYTTDIRFNNLKALAINVAEPLQAKYGPVRINSGIRNETSTPTGVSQHITGQAADFQFAGWNYERYWDAANWIKDNINYDQFIFEHSSSTGLAWFHLSYNSAGNRAASVRTKVMTMYRNHYSPGLQRFG